jgi:hypothetical protein
MDVFGVVKQPCVDPTGKQGGKTMRGQNRVPVMGVLAVALFLVWGVVQAPVARAAGTECNGTMRGDNVVLENVKVPPGASCTLDGVTVNGNVVADGATGLTITNSTVKGDVKVTNSTGNIIIEEDTKIYGNVSLKDNMDVSITIVNSTLKAVGNDKPGNLEIVNCTGEISVENNDIAGNESFIDNTAQPLNIVGNKIGGTLTVKGNDPPST